MRMWRAHGLTSETAERLYDCMAMLDYNHCVLEEARICERGKSSRVRNLYNQNNLIIELCEKRMNIFGTNTSSTICAILQHVN